MSRPPRLPFFGGFRNIVQVWRRSDIRERLGYEKEIFTAIGGREESHASMLTSILDKEGCRYDIYGQRGSIVPEPVGNRYELTAAGYLWILPRSRIINIHVGSNQYDSGTFTQQSLENYFWHFPKYTVKLEGKIIRKGSK